MTIWNRLIESKASEVVDSIGNALDNNLTNKEEILQKKNELISIVVDKLTELSSFQKEVLLAETNGNWLQRSWRPILMLSFGFIVIYAKFLAPAFNLPSTELESNFWDLLNLGMGGYVIGRSVEKITDTATKNIDIPFLRKKDRK